MKAASPNLKNFMDCFTEQVDHQLIGSSKTELDEVMEENRRLKTRLHRILKDYKTLQLQYQDHVNIHQQEEAKKPLNPKEPSELFALSLGRNSSSPSQMTKDEHHHPKTPARNEDADQGDDSKEGLALRLDCQFQASDNKKSAVEVSLNHSTPENSVHMEAEEESRETGSTKTEKNITRERGETDEVTHQNPPKRARVSVRVRCDTPTMKDGCQWRKYGQKISKGNPCPRAYYRCTGAPSCPVRKQVQRCAEDMSILITTYEGTHSHPLPITATAMASTTSAAASMLMSGSSSTTTPATENLNGLNFYLSDNDNSRSKPFYVPNSSNLSFPTITLDLTSSSSSGSTMSSHLSRLANNTTPRQYSTMNINFNSLESNPLPISWNNGIPNYRPQPLNKNQTTSSLSFGAQPCDQTLYQSYLQKNITHPDTIAAATKAITSDPSFRSALAAALSSIIGGGSSGCANASTFLPSQNKGEKSSQINSMKTSKPFHILSTFPSSASSVPLFSNTKRKSNSPREHNRDHSA